MVTSTVDAEGKTTATTPADPIKGTTAATTADPGGLRLATSGSTDTYGRRTAKRLPANTYAAIVATDNPWAQWRLNDRTMAAADAVGTRTGTYSGGTYGAPWRETAGGLVGDDDRALNMSGGDPSYVALPSDTIRGAGTTGTVEAWIAPSGPVLAA